MFVFFFFRQKSAYELRISDLSSDVCSSDLIAIVSFRQRGQTEWTVEMLVNLQTGETWRFDKIDDRASDAGRRLTRLARWPGYAALAILANALSIWPAGGRSEEHTSELQSLMRSSYAVFCLKKKQHQHKATNIQ